MSGKPERKDRRPKERRTWLEGAEPPREKASTAERFARLAVGGRRLFLGDRLPFRRRDPQLHDRLRRIQRGHRRETFVVTLAIAVTLTAALLALAVLSLRPVALLGVAGLVIALVLWILRLPRSRRRRRTRRDG